MKHWLACLSAFGLVVVAAICLSCAPARDVGNPFAQTIRAMQEEGSPVAAFMSAEKHLMRAQKLCHPPRADSEEVIVFGFSGPCTGDINAVINELESAPKDALVDPRAARMLSLLKVQRDRPQEFEAAQEAQFRQCMEPIMAHIKEEEAKVPCPGLVSNGKCTILMCGNVFDDCATFATSEQFNRWRASLKNSD